MQQSADPPVESSLQISRVRSGAWLSLPFENCTVSGRSIRVRRVVSEEQWASLEPAWDDWLRRTAGSTVFQCYAFQRLWWRHHGKSSELLILLLSDLDDQLLGIAPLMISEERKKKGKVRSLGFLCSRSEANRPVLMFGDNSRICTDVTLLWLREHRQLWEKAYLYEQVLNEQTQYLLSGLRRHGWLVAQVPDFDCPYLRLDGSWEVYLASRKRKFRKNIEAGFRKLESAGVVEYRQYQTAEEGRELILHHAELERRGWKAGKKVGISANPGDLEFYLEMASTFAELGWFTGRALLVGGRPVATTFGIRFGRTFYSMHIAHDDEFSRASPGTCLESRELKDCFAEAMDEYDFLGGFMNNKRRWTDTWRSTSVILVYPRTPYYFFMLHWTTDWKYRWAAARQAFRGQDSGVLHRLGRAGQAVLAKRPVRASTPEEDLD